MLHPCKCTLKRVVQLARALHRLPEHVLRAGDQRMLCAGGILITCTVYPHSLQTVHAATAVGACERGVVGVVGFVRLVGLLGSLEVMQKRRENGAKWSKGVSGNDSLTLYRGSATGVQCKTRMQRPLLLGTSLLGYAGAREDGGRC